MSAPPDLRRDLPDLGPHPTHALDADVTLYWPWVRPCWEEPRLEPEDDDVREAIHADTEEWRHMDWRLKQWYRWLVRDRPRA